METSAISNAFSIWELFKSYYVVWKLFFPDNAFFATPGFKSYYVVWKLESEALEKIIWKSLNRTM